MFKKLAKNLGWTFCFFFDLQPIKKSYQPGSSGAISLYGHAREQMRRKQTHNLNILNEKLIKRQHPYVFQHVSTYFSRHSDPSFLPNIALAWSSPPASFACCYTDLAPGCRPSGSNQEGLPFNQPLEKNRCNAIKEKHMILNDIE